MKRYLPVSRVAGVASRQAHCDLPAGTYEREVIFYHAGEFFSRDNIRPGMLTLHPGGITHGPHPQALKNMLQQAKSSTDEYAVMMDARDPLQIMEPAQHVEWDGYVASWKSEVT